MPDREKVMNTIKVKKIIPAVIFLCIFSPAISYGAEIRLSVAASMGDAIKELAALYSKKNTDVSIFPNLGSSGALAKQIVQGAPADLFISANTKWMDYLVKDGEVDKQTLRFFAANTLVFIGAPNSGVTSFAAIPTLSRIAIGSPQSVPAGQYAAQAMHAVGIYENLLAENKLVLAKDVRQALLYAERGEVDGAFVYKTDALMAKQAVILFTVPEDLHDRIEYPMGLTMEGNRNETAKSFYTFLTSPAALVILKKYGFSAPSNSIVEKK